MGYRFVPECNDAQESRACHLFVFLFVCFFCFRLYLSYLQERGLLRKKKNW